MSTIGMYGCAITAIAQKMTLAGLVVSPLEVQDSFVQIGCYHNYGTFNFVNWALVPLAFSHLRYNGRADFLNEPAPESAKRRIHDRLTTGHTVIVYVDANRYALGLQQHFVLAVGFGENKRIEIMNPWNGKRQGLDAYGETDEQALRGVVFMDCIRAGY